MVTLQTFVISSALKLPIDQGDQPLLLGPDLDQRVRTCVTATRKCGGTVNDKILLAAAREVMLMNEPSLLIEHGGSANFSCASGKFWASLLFKRENSKMESKNTCTEGPVNFNSQKEAYESEIVRDAVEQSVPDFIINFDEDGKRAKVLKRSVL